MYRGIAGGNNNNKFGGLGQWHAGHPHRINHSLKQRPRDVACSRKKKPCKAHFVAQSMEPMRD